MPITDQQEEYAEQIRKALEDADVRVKIDASNDKINARIRDHEMMKVPVMLVVGAKELEARTVSVRRHGKGNVGTVSLDEALSMLRSECAIPD
jgi:threonyl-tRNA synthetase